MCIIYNDIMIITNTKTLLYSSMESLSSPVKRLSESPVSLK